MAPQLWRRQLDAGAWGITAATVAQARVMLAAGVPRVLLANEVTDRPAVRWIAEQLRDPGVEIVCSVDSPRGVELLAEGLDGVPRPLPVLVELGHPGGRTGCRTSMHAVEVARLVTTKPALTLAGATGYEGTICSDRTPACLDEVRAFLDRLGGAHRPPPSRRPRGDRGNVGERRRQRVLRSRRRPSGAAGGVADRVLLRPGSYVAHDAGTNERLSPFARLDPERRFHPAIEAWGAVLSRPEPELAILGLRAAGRSLRPGPAGAVHAATPAPANASTSPAPWSSSG